jgi:hypothetical protein
LGQAAYGQFGQPGIGAWGQGGWGFGSQAGWGQRNLSQYDVNEVVRQLVPVLPIMLAQAQQPMAAYGHGGPGGYGVFGQGHRMLTPQDVNEVVRQIMPVLPQLVGLLQGGQWPHQQGYGQVGQTFYGQPFGQFGLGHQPFGQMGQMGMMPFQSAFGGSQGWGQQQRQLTPQDVGEVVRQLTAAIPQVISNLQALGQQRAI